MIARQFTGSDGVLRIHDSEHDFAWPELRHLGIVGQRLTDFAVAAIEQDGERRELGLLTGCHTDRIASIVSDQAGELGRFLDRGGTI